MFDYFPTPGNDFQKYFPRTICSAFDYTSQAHCKKAFSRPKTACLAKFFRLICGPTLSNCAKLVFHDVACDQPGYFWLNFRLKFGNNDIFSNCCLFSSFLSQAIIQAGFICSIFIAHLLPSPKTVSKPIGKEIVEGSERLQAADSNWPGLSFFTLLVNLDKCRHFQGEDH